MIHHYLGVEYEIVWDVVKNKAPELPQLKQGMADSNFRRFPHETRRTPLYRNAGLALAGVRCAQSGDQGMSRRLPRVPTG